jgi:hypothetical protein
MAEDTKEITKPKKEKAKATYKTIDVVVDNESELEIHCKRDLADCYNDILTAGRAHKNANEIARRSVGLPGTVTIQTLTPAQRSLQRREELQKGNIAQDLIPEVTKRARDKSISLGEAEKEVHAEFINREAGHATKEQPGRKKKLETLLRANSLYPDSLVIL